MAATATATASPHRAHTPLLEAIGMPPALAVAVADAEVGDVLIDFAEVAVGLPVATMRLLATTTTPTVVASVTQTVTVAERSSVRITL